MSFYKHLKGEKKTNLDGGSYVRGEGDEDEDGEPLVRVGEDLAQVDQKARTAHPQLHLTKREGKADAPITPLVSPI